jgi:hypothetical protein
MSPILTIKKTGSQEIMKAIRERRQNNKRGSKYGKKEIGNKTEKKENTKEF